MDAIYRYNKEQRQAIEDVKKKYRLHEKLNNKISRLTIKIEELEYKMAAYLPGSVEYQEIEDDIHKIKKDIRKMKAETSQYSITKLSQQSGFSHDVVSRIGKGQYFVDGDY